MFNSDDWQQNGLTAAYLGFIDCGGDPDAPSAFDWKHPKLLSSTIKHLRATTLGGESDFIDIHQRNQARKVGACNDGLCWDAWKAGVEHAVVSRKDGAPSPITGEYWAHDAFSHTVGEYDGDTLTWALAQVLKPQEVFWLVRRYRDGVPQDELAKDLCSKDKRYQDGSGHARAINFINVTIHRAKRRARVALGSRWEALAAEAV